MTITFEFRDKSWEIEYDGTTFIPKQMRETKNKEGEAIQAKDTLGYFTNIGQAIKKIVGETLGASQETIPLAVFVDRYESAVKELRGMLESEF